ncbi:MAG: NAD-dependent deacylase, partial [Phaeodactylibacter sp.]|nr:NAD-dependent deacylase [Phaeodactylibacter sp.]
DAGGLWEGHNVQDVASPEGWRRNRELVLDFYNQRRRQLMDVQPNAAHEALVELEAHYDVTIITQNVDDLHERAGSSNIIHLHGELVKVRSSVDPSLVYEWREDVQVGDKCEKGSQLRPHIVWFGEMVPMLEVAAYATADADIAMIIGTSMQVYPAAGLIGYAPLGTPVVYVDPNPSINHELSGNGNLQVIAERATVGVRQVVDALLSMV